MTKIYEVRSTDPTEGDPQGFTITHHGVHLRDSGGVLKHCFPHNGERASKKAAHAQASKVCSQLERVAAMHNHPATTVARATSA